MGSKQRLLIAAIGLVAVSATGFSEDAKVDETKTAPMISVLPNFYSSVQLRQQADVAETNDTTKGTRTLVQGRYVAGSSFLNGAVDANVTLGATKQTKTNKITQRRTYVLLALTALDTDNAAISPYADIQLPHLGSGTDANIGVYNEVKKTMTTGIGSLTLALSADGQGNFASRDAEVEVDGLTDTNKDKFIGLTGADKNMVKSDAAGITTEYGAQIILADAGKVKGLKLKYIAFVDREFSAHMQPTIIEGEERIAMTGYKATNSAYNNYRVDYKLGETGVTLTNETIQNFDGVYAARKDGTNAAKEARWTNIARVTKSL